MHTYNKHHTNKYRDHTCIHTYNIHPRNCTHKPVPLTPQTRLTAHGMPISYSPSTETYMPVPTEKLLEGIYQVLLMRMGFLSGDFSPISQKFNVRPTDVMLIGSWDIRKCLT